MSNGPEPLSCGTREEGATSEEDDKRIADASPPRPPGEYRGRRDEVKVVNIGVIRG